MKTRPLCSKASASGVVAAPSQRRRAVAASATGWLLAALAALATGCHPTAPLHAEPPAEGAGPPTEPGLHFDHQALLVGDLQRSVDFYTQVLGLQETFDGTGKDHIRWFSLGGSRQLHLIESRPAPQALPKGVHLALATLELDALIEHLRTTKIAFENFPGEADRDNTRPDGARQIYLQDPDGYWLEINDASRYWPAPRTPR